MLCPGHASLHVQVVSLLAWLHSLVSSHNACEMVILEQFASQVSQRKGIIMQVPVKGRIIASALDSEIIWE